MAPGAGFGTGEHPTTHLCLQALGFLLERVARPARVLDFGTGSGILAVGAALAGALVEAVEIDAQALAHARDNASLNGVSRTIDFRSAMSRDGAVFDIVMANILQGVLVKHAAELCVRLSRGGHLVLSGLTAPDVPAVVAAYQPMLGHLRWDVYARDEWRAILFSAHPSRAS